MERAQRLLAREAALDLPVEQVMLRRPKTLPTNATVGEVRRLFANDSIRAALLVEGPRFVSMVVRSDLPDGVADAEPALAYGSRDAPRVAPGMLVRDALALLEGATENRLVVLGDDGETLQGLVCLRATADALLVDD
jgi:CBS domain-containing protein